MSEWRCLGCQTMNEGRKKKCAACLKLKPKKRVAKHRLWLELPYAVFLEANGGVDECGVCGKPPNEKRRLDRDHDHRGAGKPRGLLCWAHNKLLDPRWTPDHLRRAADYLERAA